jgi:hypothetical protein
MANGERTVFAAVQDFLPEVVIVSEIDPYPNTTPRPNALHQV